MQPRRERSRGLPQTTNGGGGGGDGGGGGGGGGGIIDPRHGFGSITDRKREFQASVQMMMGTSDRVYDDLLRAHKNLVQVRQTTTTT